VKTRALSLPLLLLATAASAQIRAAAPVLSAPSLFVPVAPVSVLAPGASVMGASGFSVVSPLLSAPVALSAVPAGLAAPAVVTVAVAAPAAAAADESAARTLLDPARRLNFGDLRRIADDHQEAVAAFTGIRSVRGVGIDVDAETGTKPHFVIMLDGTRRPSQVRREAAGVNPGLPVVYEIRPDAIKPAPARTPSAGSAYLAAARRAGLSAPLTGLDDARLSDPRALLASGWTYENVGGDAYVYAPSGRVVQVYVVAPSGSRHLVTYRRGAEYVRSETLSSEDGKLTRTVERETPEQFAKREAQWERQRAELRSPEGFAKSARRLFADVRRAEAARAAAPEAVATDDELRGRLERLPATNPEREKYVVDLFKLAGAHPEEIVLQDAGRGRNNILVIKKGRTDRVIVVGGHHDKVSAGAGSIDNGTGATMVANLYQALRDQETDATIVFIAFAREEEGLIGSKHYLESLTPAQRAKIDAMVNLDTLAVDGTFSWQNNSTRALLDRIRAVAAEKGRALVESHLDGGDADSSTFREAGIPAITVFGASQDVIFDIIHTERDTMAAFSLEHYRNAYLLTLELLQSLDARPLGPVDGA